MAEFVRVDVSEGVATITIDRPQKKNAMTYAMLGDFIAAVAEADADEASRVVLVTGVPGSFCAGTDLADLATVPGEQRGLRGGAAERERWWPLVACSKPTICAVDGPAVGMGAEFTVQCDLRLCSPRARFAWNFAHRGLVADTGAGTWLLPRIIGVQRALRLLYTGEFLSADEALTLGYVTEVVESSALVDRATELARTIAAMSSPLSNRLTKRLVYDGLTSPLDEHMVRHTASLTTCFRSDDHREGVASFLEGRPASFTGR